MDLSTFKKCEILNGTQLTEEQKETVHFPDIDHEFFIWKGEAYPLGFSNDYSEGDFWYNKVDGYWVLIYEEKYEMHLQYIEDTEDNFVFAKEIKVEV